MPTPADLQAEVTQSVRYSDTSDSAVAHKRQLALEVLSEIEAVVPPGALLDVGCGPGILLVAARERGWRAVGLELATASVAQARDQECDVRDVSLEDAGFADNSFDAVVLHHVLEHIPNPVAFLQRCMAVLRPGGVLFIAVPNARSWRVRLKGDVIGYVYQTDHVLYFNQRALSRLVERVGGTRCRLRTCRLGGRAGSLVNRHTMLRPIRPLMERLGMGVEIRCIAQRLGSSGCAEELSGPYRLP